MRDRLIVGETLVDTGRERGSEGEPVNFNPAMVAAPARIRSDVDLVRRAIICLVTVQGAARTRGELAMTERGLRRDAYPRVERERERERTTGESL